MTPDNEITTEVNATQGGKIIFAPDVIATIASFAAAEVEGVVGMAGGVGEPFCTNQAFNGKFRFHVIHERKLLCLCIGKGLRI